MSDIFKEETSSKRSEYEKKTARKKIHKHVHSSYLYRALKIIGFTVCDKCRAGFKPVKLKASRIKI